MVQLSIKQLPCSSLRHFVNIGCNKQSCGGACRKQSKSISSANMIAPAEGAPTVLFAFAFYEQETFLFKTIWTSGDLNPLIFEHRPFLGSVSHKDSSKNGMLGRGYDTVSRTVQTPCHSRRRPLASGPWSWSLTAPLSTQKSCEKTTNGECRESGIFWCMRQCKPEFISYSQPIVQTIKQFKTVNKKEKKLKKFNGNDPWIKRRDKWRPQ